MRCPSLTFARLKALPAALAAEAGVAESVERLMRRWQDPKCSFCYGRSLTDLSQQSQRRPSWPVAPLPAALERQLARQRSRYDREDFRRWTHAAVVVDTWRWDPPWELSTADRKGS